MQVYLIKSANNTFNHIQTFLDQLGHTITTKDSSNDLLKEWKAAENHILAGDAVIVEASSLTEANIFELYLASKHNKPTLFLYNKDESKESLIQQVKLLDNKQLTTSEYRDKEDLAKKVIDFINIIKDQLDAKLFMIIPPTVNKYLEWIANYTNKSKSDVVRSSVERTAKEDDDYQAFLKSALQ